MSEENTTQSPPNIVLILADDLGYSDIGCFGSEIRTPNLDRMASQGVRFTQMYNCGRCCPTRASLLTGLYPHQAGIGDMVVDLNVEPYQGFLNDQCVTIAEVLRDRGYATGMAGKWHVGGTYASDDPDWHKPNPRKPRPLDRGFDRFFGTLAGACSYYWPHALMRDSDPVHEVDEDFYFTDAISENAVGMIEDSVEQDRPFFVHVSYNAPHWPLHALPEDIEKYRGSYSKGWDPIRTDRYDRLIGDKLLDPKWPISPRNENAPEWNDITEKDWEDARMSVYAAQVDRLDQGIGRILETLEQLGIADNTLVMFLSDNGGCAEFIREDGIARRCSPFTVDGRAVRGGNNPDFLPGADDTYMSYELPWANVSNSPFRLFKQWVHEGGISTPFIARWPEAIQPNTISHSPAHVVDLMATCIDVAGTSYPKDFQGNEIKPTEGESFAPALRGETWARQQPIYWEHQGNRAARQGNWKLVAEYNKPWELYEMNEDRTELNDLSAKNSPKTKEMLKLYEDYEKRGEVLPWEKVKPPWAR